MTFLWLSQVKSFFSISGFGSGHNGLIRCGECGQSYSDPLDLLQHVQVYIIFHFDPVKSSKSTTARS